jgi:hypothetical protein
VCNNPFSFRETGISNNQNSNTSLFLSADEWNKLITFVYEAYQMRLYYDNSKKEFSDYTNAAKYEANNTEYKGDIRAGAEYNNGRNAFMTAHMANGILAKMYYFQEEQHDSLNTYGKKGGPSGDIITAEYFNYLSEYANNLEIKKGDRCAIKCNSCQDCDDCQVCNVNVCETTTTCQGCNSCDTDNPDE